MMKKMRNYVPKRSLWSADVNYYSDAYMWLYTFFCMLSGVILSAIHFYEHFSGVFA